MSSTTTIIWQRKLVMVVRIINIVLIMKTSHLNVFFLLMTGGVNCLLYQDKIDHHNWDGNLVTPVKGDVKIHSWLEGVEDSRK